MTQRKSPIGNQPHIIESTACHESRN